MLDTLIRGAQVFDGTGAPPVVCDVGLKDGRIAGMGLAEDAAEVVDGAGLALAPGFIDTHTHDDLAVIQTPEMLPKLSQGVTTVIVGNCGISGSPVRASQQLPDPMELLGEPSAFRYETFAEYVKAVEAAGPSVNVAALIGHTALRNNHMDRLDRAATPGEIWAMRQQLKEALDHGALGLSTGLAYLSAFSASTEEVVSLAEELNGRQAVYATHLRSETEQIVPALHEAFEIGRAADAQVVVSHLKCAGIANWGRSREVLGHVESAAQAHPVGCDCYPYAAGSSTLDLRQVDERVKIGITWSKPHPEMAGRTLGEIAATWGVCHLEAAKRLQPAGAIYHSISEEDMQRILSHPLTMIGSDGLPQDPRPHPRLWGTFPRVLGRYSRELGLFSLQEAIRKMTSLSAQRFGLKDRGVIRQGYAGDLVLFNPLTVRDNSDLYDPIRPASGIEAVWVNGAHSYRHQHVANQLAGRLLRRP